MQDSCGFQYISAYSGITVLLNVITDIKLRVTVVYNELSMNYINIITVITTRLDLH